MIDLTDVELQAFKEMLQEVAIANSDTLQEDDYRPFKIRRDKLIQENNIINKVLEQLK